MEEECDYMSDNFLASCVPSEDLRPGLVHSRVKQREYQMAKKKERSIEEYKKNNVSSKVLASEQLNKGLEKPLGPENRGFSMLQKMGFQPGSSLGSKQTGILEPIGISLKNDRKGLGREQALKDIQLKKQYYRQKKKETSLNVEDYRAGLSKKYRERDIMSDLWKSEKACHKLDAESGIDAPEEPWFWPQRCLPEKEEEGIEEPEEDEADIEYGPAEKLEMLTLYLRQSYMYCIWCGVKFDDEKDLSSSCPGSTKDDH